MLRITVLLLLLVGSSSLVMRENNQGAEATFLFKAPKARLIPKPRIEGRAPRSPPTKEVKHPDMPPIPTTTKCIVIMCVQFMVIYTALAICRTYHEWSETTRGDVEAGLKSAAQTLTYGPMLCVLFIACRLHVEFVSDSRGQPQMWVQNCMYAVTFAVTASSLLVFAIPLVTGRTVALKEGDHYLESQDLRTSAGMDIVAFKALTFTRYLLLIGIHGGVVSIIYGTHKYLPPGEIDPTNVPAPGPAIKCTMIMAVVFFVTQLVIAVCRTCEEAKFSFLEFPRIVGVMNAAATAVEFAPMLAILFLSARTHAIQNSSEPQAWAQSCMFIATGSMCVATLLAVLVPLLTGAHMEINPQTREASFSDSDATSLGYVFLVMRFICMLGFYSGALGVIVSIFVFKAPEGPTMLVPPAIHCVVILTCQFFFVYFMMTVMLTVSELSGGRYPLETYGIYTGLEHAKATVAFAPMLSILFVTTRMYSRLLTDNKGAPPAWVQDGMFMATWSLMLSFMACLCTSLFMDKVETDDDGNVVNKFSNTFLASVMTGLRFLTMLLLYGGMVLVIVGIFTMTPETANGRGSVVSRAVNAQDLPQGEAPPGPVTALSFLAIQKVTGMSFDSSAIDTGMRS